MSRRLYAIMFTDMVDFTRLMHLNESTALSVRKRFKEITDSQNIEFKGSMLQYFGDGTLSLFENASDALHCAISMQKEFLKDPQVPVRIGLHLGDVLINDGEALGDSVNIASRIESFAVSGSVFISDSFYDHVKNIEELSWKPMGSFRLKNVDRSYQIYACETPGIDLPSDDFILGKGTRLAEFSRTFPSPSHPILGRKEDTGKVLDLLNVSRVVTITGTGGIGKTRLSLEICERLKPDYGKGITWFSMATLSNVEEVMPTLASHLEIHESVGRSALKAVADTIADSRALIVLDNLEHINSASREIAELVELCPNLNILCTSRTPLKIRGEKEFGLSPLAIPEETETAEFYSSVNLFVDRAMDANPDFKLTGQNTSDVVDICKRLDGLPLAIELAAARIRIMSPSQLLERLGQSLDLLGSGMHDIPERHRTLRSTINWSFELLNNSEKELFSNLSVFLGSFTLEAVEKVCYPEETKSFDAILHLESLVEKGMVSTDRENQRFSMLQTLRDFAFEQLSQSEVFVEIRDRHADWYCKYAEYIEEGTMGTDQVKRLKEGSLEEANINSALDYLLEKSRKGDIEAREKGLSICGDLWMYWHMRGKNVSTNVHISGFLEAIDDMTPTHALCNSLTGSGVAYWITGNIEKALETSHLQYQMAKELDSQEDRIKSLLVLTISSLSVDLSKAFEYSEKCYEEALKTANPYWIGTALFFKGLPAFISGDLDTAESLYTEGLKYVEQSGDYESRGSTLSGLALIKVSRGKLDEGLKLYDRSIDAFNTTGDRAEVARVLSEMSWALIAAGDIERSRTLTLESIRVYQEVGSTRGVGISMLGLAAIEALENNPYQATQIASAADHFAEQEGIVNDFGYSSQDRSLIETAGEAMGEEELSSARVSGKNLSVAQVVEMAQRNVVLTVES